MAEDFKEEETVSGETKKGVGDAIKGGFDKVKDTVHGALDTDGDGKIELEDFKDRAGQVGSAIKDGAEALGGKLKEGFEKIGDSIKKKD